MRNNVDPFAELGLEFMASEERVRARYLELVKKFPPEKDPEAFQRIQAAFDIAKDPLKIADQLLTDLEERDQPWEDVIQQHSRQLPPLRSKFLLSLGNRPQDDANLEDVSREDGLE